MGLGLLVEKTLTIEFFHYLSHFNQQKIVVTGYSLKFKVCVSYILPGIVMVIYEKAKSHSAS